MTGLIIGCGGIHPREGEWDCVDLRDLGHVKYVQDGADLSNIASEAYDRVIAQDVVEHIPWRHVPAALAHWVRVLKPGGLLEVGTPNAAELVEQIRNPEASGLSRWGNESDWQRFCRTAFGHQDYPGNFHACYFTPEWLTDLLQQTGAKDVHVADVSLERFRLEATK